MYACGFWYCELLIPCQGYETCLADENKGKQIRENCKCSYA